MHSDVEVLRVLTVRSTPQVSSNVHAYGETVVLYVSGSANHHDPAAGCGNLSAGA